MRRTTKRKRKIFHKSERETPQNRVLFRLGRNREEVEVIVNSSDNDLIAIGDRSLAWRNRLQMEVLVDLVAVAKRTMQRESER